MGARLVGAALNPYWATRLTPTERLVLIAMCHTAKDVGTAEQPSRMYFAGHDTLMITLTGDEQEPGSARHEAARKQVQRAVKGLTEAGALTLVTPGKKGRNTYYQVTPDNYAAPAEPVDNLGQVVHLRPVQRDTDVPQKRTQMSR